MANLADRVRLLRAARGWTMADVARFVGCNPSNIAHIEAGRVTNPKKPTLRALAKCFGVSVDYLKGVAND